MTPDIVIWPPQYIQDTRVYHTPAYSYSQNIVFLEGSNHAKVNGDLLSDLYQMQES